MRVEKHTGGKESERVGRVEAKEGGGKNRVEGKNSEEGNEGVKEE